MTGPAFNAARDPWITVLGLDGRVRDVGVRQALVDAHEFAGVLGHPSEVVAVERLLLAVLHRAIDGPRDDAAWTALRASERAPRDQVHAYLDTWAERFDLTGPAPFLQSPGLASTSGKIAAPGALVPAVGEYLSERASHVPLTWAQATLALVHTHAYDVSGIKTGMAGDPEVTGGKGMPRGSGWCARIGAVTVRGASLWDTLTMAATPLDEDHAAPAWERPPTGPAARGTAPEGRCDLLTWQSRRILLHGDDQHVTGVTLGQGDRITEPPVDVEQQCGWAHQGRAVRPWRPLHARPLRTLLTDILTGEHRATLVSHLERRPPAGTVRLGLTSVDHGPKGTVWVDERGDEVTLPGAVLGDTETRARVLTALEETRAGLVALRLFAKNVTLAAAGPVAERAGHTAREDDVVLAAGDDIDRALARWLVDPADLFTWREQAAAILRRHAQQLVDDAPTASWVGRRIDGRDDATVPSRARFLHALREALPAAPRKLTAPGGTDGAPDLDGVDFLAAIPDTDGGLDADDLGGEPGSTGSLTHDPMAGL